MCYPICKTLNANKPENRDIFCDLEGHRRTNTTIPISCIVTNQIADLCIYSKNENRQSLTVVELTVPFELNIEKAHVRKTEKYSSLISDLKDNDIETHFIGLEIGSRGYINNDNSKRLKDLLKICDCKISFKDFRNTLSKIAIVSSFALYHAKDEPTWDDKTQLLKY